MAKKNTDTVEETTAAEAVETETTEATESGANESNEVSAETKTEDTPKEEPQEVPADAEDAAAKPEDTENTSIVDSVVSTVSSAVGTVAEAVVSGVENVVAAITGDDSGAAKKTSHRAERIGVVSSDKMTKTVVVRVDRQVKHPVYRKYVRSRKNFMAHDDHGAKVGDKVRIQETRPLSARKRWRVVEIIQKAER